MIYSIHIPCSHISYKMRQTSTTYIQVHMKHFKLQVTVAKLYFKVVIFLRFTHVLGE